MKKLLFLTFLFLFTTVVIAQIKYVPDDYSMIQHAINDSKDGDTIIVEPGVYCQQFNFKGKAITVASRYLIEPDTSYISNTIIDGMFLEEKDSSSLVYFISGEDSTSVLQGFTLRNGKGTYGEGTNDYYTAGGAILLDNSGGSILNNIIRDNRAIVYNNKSAGETAWGGGIDCSFLPEDLTLKISDNSIINNYINSTGSLAMGGAIDLYWTSGRAIISKNKIIGNKVKAKDSGYGGGISAAGASSKSNILLDNNFICGNKTFSEVGYSKGAGIVCYFSAPKIRNNIIVDNSTDYPQDNAQFAFGGGIAVHWYKELVDEWPICDNPLNLVAIIENNTIAYNNDKIAGGGVALRSVAANLKNNIIGCNFSNNNAQIKVEYPDAIETKSRTVKVDYCNVEGGVEGISKFYNGTGNINIFPEFSDEEHWYLKRDLSPCIDSGDPSKDYEDIEDQFFSGRACFPALGTKRNDIGAFGGPYSKWQQMTEPTDVEDLVSIEIHNLPYLSQNYPNPFNPSTTIKYQIPDQVRNDKMFVTLSGAEESFVTLKVYDILGREVAFLVNENQKPGNYKVVWNASDLPSGVYFYELSYGAFIETKKLTLIK